MTAGAEQSGLSWNRLAGRPAKVSQSAATMLNLISRLRVGVPDRFLAAIAVALAFMIYVTWDQLHWWKSKPDYAFGWLVPLFVVYLMVERWPRFRQIFAASTPVPRVSLIRGAIAAGMGLVLGGGLAVFLLGAFYRVGAGVSQPGSIAVAFGFCGILLGIVYFNVPNGWVGKGAPATGWRALREDARLRTVSLLFFPALIWMLSAPLVTAVENAISLFLLQHVVSVVFAVFNFLGFPMLQEGNVLILPRGHVGVVDACSGIRSLTGCLFAGSFLGAVFLDRLWKKILLLAVAMALAFLTNLLRSLFLTGWAYAYGSDAIEGSLHDYTGFAVLALTTAGLFGLLPLFSSQNWRRWLRFEPVAVPA